MQKRGRPYAEKTVTGITFTRHYRLQVKKLCCENCNLKEVLSLSLHLVGNQLAYKAIRKLTSSLPFLMVLLVLQSASCLTSLEKSCPCGNQCNVYVNIKGILLIQFLLLEPSSCRIKALRFSLSLWWFWRINVFSCCNLLHCGMPGRKQCFLYGWLKLCAFLTAYWFVLTLDDCFIA